MEKQKAAERLREERRKMNELIEEQIKLRMKVFPLLLPLGMCYNNKKTSFEFVEKT